MRGPLYRCFFFSISVKWAVRKAGFVPDLQKKKITFRKSFGCIFVFVTIFQKFTEQCLPKREQVGEGKGFDLFDRKSDGRQHQSQCLKIDQKVAFDLIPILAFSTNFYPIKIDMSGNTVWPQTSGFQKLAKMDHFLYFKLTFVHSKCKRSSLRSQCWMRLFLWFSNTVTPSK